MGSMGRHASPRAYSHERKVPTMSSQRSLRPVPATLPPRGMRFPFASFFAFLAVAPMLAERAALAQEPAPSPPAATAASASPDVAPPPPDLQAPAIPTSSPPVAIDAPPAPRLDVPTTTHPGDGAGDVRFTDANA